MYSHGNKKLVRLAPLMFAEWFALQKCSLFGFGPHANMIIKRFL